MNPLNLIHPDKGVAKTSQSFTDWKINLDLLYRNNFGTTAEYLPDMPYWNMYEEQVDTELIILRMKILIENSTG